MVVLDRTAQDRAVFLYHEPYAQQDDGERDFLFGKILYRSPNIDALVRVEGVVLRII